MNENFKISVLLKTDDYRGDHVSDISIAYNIDENITVKELVRKIFSNKIYDFDGKEKITRDHIEIRVCEELK